MRKFWIKEPDFFDQEGPFIKDTSVRVPKGRFGELVRARFPSRLWVRQRLCFHEHRSIVTWTEGNFKIKQMVCSGCWLPFGMSHEKA